MTDWNQQEAQKRGLVSTCELDLHPPDVLTWKQGWWAVSLLLPAVSVALSPSIFSPQNVWFGPLISKVLPAQTSDITMKQMTWKAVSTIKCIFKYLHLVTSIIC